MTKIKKTFVNVIKKRYVFLVQFNSTPDAQEMAFKESRQLKVHKRQPTAGDGVTSHNASNIVSK